LLLLSTADGIDLVKKEHDGPIRSGRLEDSTDAFRPGADVLPHQLRASDVMEVDTKLASRRLRKQVLSGSLWAVKKNPVLNDRASRSTEAICSDGQHVLLCACNSTDVSQFDLGNVRPMRYLARLRAGLTICSLHRDAGVPAKESE
jgi:hypothetical protein